jgi:hypothetical protein
MKNSDNILLANTAHAYSECSSEGLCDRQTGVCECFEGFDGVACQRASCPGFPAVCSGHGVCKSAKQLAAADGNNDYKLWDKDSTMGCACDPGYTAPDCSQRTCKHGVDPLYFDDIATVKYPIYDFGLFSTSNATDWSQIFTDGANSNLNGSYSNSNGHGVGHWAIRFFDPSGEDWVTRPIETGASCSLVVAALEALPQNVVPANSLHCTRTQFLRGIENTFTETGSGFFDADHPQSSDKAYRLSYRLALWEAQTASDQSDHSPAMAVANLTSSNSSTHITLSGYIYRLKFFGNPGRAPEPEVEVYVDGKRPGFVSPGAKAIVKVWTDGQQAESRDFFANHCHGVTVTVLQRFVSSATTVVHGAVEEVVYESKAVSFLDVSTMEEKNLLKACLGDADGDPDNNVDVYNWDFGNKFYPHLIKLERTVRTWNDGGGYYAAIWYDTDVIWDGSELEGTFRLLNPFTPPDHRRTDRYEVYTTDGVLALTSPHAQATFNFASKFFYTSNTTFDTDRQLGYQFDGDISCYAGQYNADKWKYIQQNAQGVYHCLEKGDYFTALSFDFPFENPPNINLYRAQRVYKDDYKWSVKDFFKYGGIEGYNEMHYMVNTIVSDLATNWAAAVGDNRRVSRQRNVPYEATLARFHIYQFTPADSSTFVNVAECSNRGKCDRETGICRCFAGYTKDDCSVQSTIML